MSCKREHQPPYFANHQLGEENISLPLKALDTNCYIPQTLGDSNGEGLERFRTEERSKIRRRGNRSSWQESSLSYLLHFRYKPLGIYSNRAGLLLGLLQGPIHGPRSMRPNCLFLHPSPTKALTCSPAKQDFLSMRIAASRCPESYCVLAATRLDCDALN